MTGWLKDDATLKDIGNYKVCKFCVKAEKYNRKTKDKEAVFIDCDLWGKKAESLLPMLRKGKYVQVIGTIENLKYIALNASEITLLSQAEEIKQDDIPLPDNPPPQDQLEQYF